MSSEVISFLNSIEDNQQRKDCFTLTTWLEKLTGMRPSLYGNQIVGFGEYRYKYKSGREGQWIRIGFSPRRKNISIYLIAGFHHFPDLMKDLGDFKTGKSCLYVKSLDDVDTILLRRLLELGFTKMNELYPPDKD